MQEKLTEKIDHYIKRYNEPPYGREIEGTVELLQECKNAICNNGWIPCSKLLPEDGQEVLATDGEYVYLVEYDGDLDAPFGDLDKIIAWQPLPPLPEPYQPKGE